MNVYVLEFESIAASLLKLCRKGLLAPYVLIGLFLLFLNPWGSTMIAEFSFPELVKEADVIVKGQVTDVVPLMTKIKIEESKDEHIFQFRKAAHFQVEKVYKGSLDSKEIKIAWKCSFECDCTSYEKGKKYVVFLVRSEKYKPLFVTLDWDVGQFHIEKDKCYQLRSSWRKGNYKITVLQLEKNIYDELNRNKLEDYKNWKVWYRYSDWKSENQSWILTIGEKGNGTMKYDKSGKEVYFMLQKEDITKLQNVFSINNFFNLGCTEDGDKSYGIKIFTENNIKVKYVKVPAESVPQYKKFHTIKKYLDFLISKYLHIEKNKL